MPKEKSVKVNKREHDKGQYYLNATLENGDKFSYDHDQRTAPCDQFETATLLNTSIDRQHWCNNDGGSETDEYQLGGLEGGYSRIAGNSKDKWHEYGKKNVATVAKQAMAAMHRALADGELSPTEQTQLREVWKMIGDSTADKKITDIEAQHIIDKAKKIAANVRV